MTTFHLQRVPSGGPYEAVRVFVDKDGRRSVGGELLLHRDEAALMAELVDPRTIRALEDLHGAWATAIRAVGQTIRAALEAGDVRGLPAEYLAGFRDVIQLIEETADDFNAQALPMQAITGQANGGAHR